MALALRLTDEGTRVHRRAADAAVGRRVTRLVDGRDLCEMVR